ncbi:hypothetical protein RUM43_006335 [Polyplax serrata]|uniref:Uncharacterized protein n=1 Tax=Polyplax serrata TaxID=468196 RepID=A0AAN8PYL1_POLSC
MNGRKRVERSSGEALENEGGVQDEHECHLCLYLSLYSRCLLDRYCSSHLRVLFSIWRVPKLLLILPGDKAKKTKRDVSGLFPFPRVGRGDVTWYSRYLGPHEVKRQGLIPFPRVGRSGDGNAEKKGDIAENGGAMWFGPRLGRLQKRNYFDDDDWALVSLRDVPAVSSKKEFLPASGRESLDEIDQTKDYRA